VVAVSGGGGGGSRLRTVVLPLLLCASFSRRWVSFLFSSSSTSAFPCFSALLLLSAGGGGSNWDCGRWLGNQVAAAMMVVLRRFFFVVQRRKPFFFVGRSSLLQKCPPLKAIVGFHLPHFMFFPTCIYRQPGERFAIPCSSAGHGSPSHFSSIMLAGYGCVGMGSCGFFGQVGWREKENSGKQRFKIFFFPASACAGKKENSAV